MGKCAPAFGWGALFLTESEMIVESTADNVHLLLTGQLDKVNGIAGNTDGQLRILFGMIHRIQQNITVQHIHVDVMAAFHKVAVQKLSQIALTGFLLTSQCAGHNGEGVGNSVQIAKTIEEATGMETRATILGHMQRGGSPTAKDRVYASIMGAKAVDLLVEGKTNRVVGYKHGEYVDFDIDEALNMEKGIPQYQYDIAKELAL